MQAKIKFKKMIWNDVLMKTKLRYLSLGAEKTERIGNCAR
jgi:hypothetical protein